ncbi:amino acid ABC transporter permease [Entomomonas asaccharolytica]|uniref:Amino acid ABC transporter permease n=1 Tax=Entomomonas asaccharolytica TaxID=2785331 RepID=A0A974NGW7_9GAMM|nr:amino acid ABC transporter permease [Entomomonas asaccharolytica]QQP86443.1 amino acid ABC transporter permease [Entomomonas asaccharolytica]
MFNWSYIHQVLPTFEHALWLTVKISAVGILAAIIIGAVCSIVIFYRITVVSAIAKGYVAFFRNTPLLLHLFFIYFGLPRAFKITLSFEVTALIGLSLLGGAYMAEAFRSGIEAVAKSQFESGQAIGLNRLQMIRYIVLPQAISYCVPALGANCIFLFKETSVFTAIAGTDITTIAINFISNDGHSNENLLLLVVAYLIVILPFILLLSYIEKRMRHAEFGN